mgnify:CR=1 FL=1
MIKIRNAAPEDPVGEWPPFFELKIRLDISIFCQSQYLKLSLEKEWVIYKW